MRKIARVTSLASIVSCIVPGYGTSRAAGMRVDLGGRDRLAVLRRDNLRGRGAGEDSGQQDNKRGSAHRRNSLMAGGRKWNRGSNEFRGFRAMRRARSQSAAGASSNTSASSAPIKFVPATQARMKIRSTLLGTAATILLAFPAFAQEAPATPQQQPATAPTAQDDTQAAQAVNEDYGDEEEIVVQGTRARGSVIGDIPPQNILDSRDVRATGATSIDELLDALAPQIGSAQGRERRTAGPAPQRPAHRRLPRASRYSARGDRAGRDPARGSRAQIWLSRRPEGREHRPSPALPLDHRAGRRASSRPKAATLNGNADLTQFSIQRNGRTTLNAHVEGNSMLTEAERNILDLAAGQRDDRGASSPPARCWARKRDARVSGDFQPPGSRRCLGDTEHRTRAYRRPFADRARRNPARAAGPQDEQRQRACRAYAQRDQIGLALDFDQQRRSRARRHPHRSRRRHPRERARETTASGDIKATANGNLFTLPAGDASTTITLARKHGASRRRATATWRGQLQFARPDGGRGRDQPRPADLAPEPRFQRARQPEL